MSDDLQHIRARAQCIKDLLEQVGAERVALRTDLTRADRERGGKGREELAAAAKGGLSRALVLEHLVDLSVKVRKFLKSSGLEADVTVRPDGSVRLTDLDLSEGETQDEKVDLANRIKRASKLLKTLNRSGQTVSDVDYAFTSKMGLTITITVSSD